MPASLRSAFASLLVLLHILLANGCTGEAGDAAAIQAPTPAGAPSIEPILAEGLALIEAHADTMDAAMQPLPLLRSAQVAALKRSPNREQVARGRRLGIPPGQSDEALETLRQEGRLVRLADSSAYWVVRELDYSMPLVTPDVEALLTEIGRRFHARLAELGLPPLRVEVTSALRTASTQAALRRSNPNAAQTVSAHEFGTTIDIAYSSFAAPERPGLRFDLGEAAWLAPYLQQIATGQIERVAARRSRELQAILGKVLIELQREGKVLVTLEELQPVYHMTVAERF